MGDSLKCLCKGSKILFGITWLIQLPGMSHSMEFWSIRVLRRWPEDRCAREDRIQWDLRTIEPSRSSNIVCPEPGRGSCLSHTHCSLSLIVFWMHSLPRAIFSPTVGIHLRRRRLHVKISVKCWQLNLVSVRQLPVSNSTTIANAWWRNRSWIYKPWQSCFCAF